MTHKGTKRPLCAGEIFLFSSTGPTDASCTFLRMLSCLAPPFDKLVVFSPGSSPQSFHLRELLVICHHFNSLSASFSLTYLLNKSHYFLQTHSSCNLQVRTRKNNDQIVSFLIIPSTPPPLFWRSLFITLEPFTFVPLAQLSSSSCKCALCVFRMCAFPYLPDRFTPAACWHEISTQRSSKRFIFVCLAQSPGASAMSALTSRPFWVQHPIGMSGILHNKD